MRRSMMARATRWVMVSVTLLGLAASRPAGAYTFALTSGGDNEYLTGLWTFSQGSSMQSCLTSAIWPCPTIFSSGGNIPLQSFRNPFLLAGGSLDWSTQPGQLKVVAMPVVNAKALYNGVTADAWAAVDARTNPLTFEIVPQPGDPVPLLPNLQIVPRLVGNINQYTNLGTSTSVDFRATMRVEIDGQTVSFDSLTALFGVADGPDTVWSAGFRKGAANYAYVTGVPVGAQISIAAWIYLRGFANSANNTYSIMEATSAYGEGLAIEILVRDGNAVDVPESPPPTKLALATRPNPSSGPTGVGYVLPRSSPVRLSIFDLRGRRVAMLVDRVEPAGPHEVTWNGKDSRGDRVTPGVYLVRLETGAERTIGKLVLLGR